MARHIRPLTRAETEELFRIATRALPKWYVEQIAQGMTDIELETALRRVLGIFGGSCGPDRLSVAHQASGLKIWGGWHIVNHCTERPLIQGARTIAMARYLYAIDDPNNHQSSLSWY